MATPNPNFDAIASTTLKNYQKKFADNVSNGNVAIKYMKMKAAVIEDGGDKLVEELMYATGGGGSYSGTDPMDITVPEGLTAAEYDWKQEYATIPITGTDELRNSGKEKMQSLLEARTKQAQIRMMNRLGVLVYGDGTGNNGKDILGFDAYMSTTPTVGILGGINRATAANAFWRNYANTSVGSFATNGLSATGTAVRSITRGTDKPTVIWVGNTIYGYWETAANGRAQFNNPKLAELGFQALKFEAIDVLYDPQCTADRQYLHNTDYLKLKIHSSRNFSIGKMIEPADQDFKVAKVLFAGQMSGSNCQLQGVMSGFSA